MKFIKAIGDGIVFVVYSVAELLNPQQWKMVGAMLLGATGPLAWLLDKKLGLSDNDVKMWLDFAALIMPTIGGAIVTKLTSRASQIIAAKQMPESVQTQLISALPDKSILTAAGSLEGVKVKVSENASPSALDAAHDPSVPGVKPA